MPRSAKSHRLAPFACGHRRRTKRGGTQERDDIALAQLSFSNSPFDRVNRTCRHHALGLVRGRVALVLALLLSPGSAAFGFPLLDSTFGGSGATSGGNATSSGDTAGSSDITGTRDLTSGESTDLLHQLQLVNGVSAPAGGGWTFIPRVEIDEELTDNVYQVNSPRRWDLITYLSPGFSLAADLPRLTLTMSYSPSLALYTHTGPLNALTQQLNALGTVTVVPELAFVDLRAMSGVSNVYGGLGNQGGFGTQA